MGVKPRPGKVVVVTTDLGVGGAEAMLTRLVTAQPSIADEVTVVSLRPEDDYVERLRTAGVKVVQLDFRRARGIASGLIELAKLIAERRPDVVQGWMYHGDLAALLALALSGRRSRTRLVWSVRCSDMDLRQYGFGLRAAVKTCTLLSRRPDAVTANSAAGLKFHLELGYRPRRAEVIPNGIDMEEFRPDLVARRAVRHELGIEDAAIVIAHVARVDPMKDHSTFLAAMAQLPEIRALLIGVGTENLAASPNVFRLGRRRDVARLLTAADFIASSSRFGEGFSNAIAEGMACGLPGIVTDVGDARLIVGDTGLVVPCEDAQAMVAAMQTLAQEPIEARTARRVKARMRIAENFALPTAVKRFAALYASLQSACG
jgi:glycosyltransferase involved in cell wall biosynthesis